MESESSILIRNACRWLLSITRSLRLAALSLSALPLISCVTEGEGSSSGPTHYTLRAEKAIEHGRPLPAETPITVEWHSADESVRRVRGFIGWDFTGSGRFEMVEVLNEDGTVQARVFDFDGDGRVDEVKRP